MCGRYVVTCDLDQLRAMFNVTDRPNFEANWNAAPTQSLPVIRRGKEGERRLSLIRWGLVPHWSKTPPEKSKPMINARSETASEKPMFRTAIKRRRALIPANGFYEWTTDEEGRQPWYIIRTDEAPMVFGGVWERWGEGTEQVDSFAILTTDANADIAHLHNRCPLLIDKADYNAWLNPEVDPDPFMIVQPRGVLQARKVTRDVNAVRNNGPDLLKPV